MDKKCAGCGLQTDASDPMKQFYNGKVYYTLCWGCIDFMLHGDDFCTLDAVCGCSNCVIERFVTTLDDPDYVW